MLHDHFIEFVKPEGSEPPGDRVASLSIYKLNESFRVWQKRKHMIRAFQDTDDAALSMNDHEEGVMYASGGRNRDRHPFVRDFVKIGAVVVCH